MEIKEPYYEFENLKKACQFALEGSDDVEIKDDAFEDAQTEFGISNKKELYQTIINFEISELTYIKTRSYHKTDEIPPPKVDSYKFVYKFNKGYLAFFMSERTGAWSIKSFKKYDDKYESFENEIGRQLRELNLFN
ncbi:MAG: hypothetical protein PF487_06815 [Bacteroidales bacterium]|nr:hypothetical protein [Bacteroidales bacterium]